MHVLVLGGTVFLSRAVVVEALARGHTVTCACRSRSGAPPPGARHVSWDRSGAPPPDIGSEPDAVVDVARIPSWVRAAVGAWPGAHWSFVSTVNVYSDNATPGQTPATGPLLEPEHGDVDAASDPESYGRMKVSCEQSVTAGAAASFVVRPGLIVGPGDPLGRFSYWPERLDEVRDRPGSAADVLAPGDPSDVVQVIDVRDLAAWIVDAAERRLTGVHDGVGLPMPIGALLTEIGAEDPTWVPSDFLTAHGVEPWSGPRSVPLWLPRPEYDGMLAHDPAPSLEAGLRLRPLAETAADTLTWLRAAPAAADAARTGLDRGAEQEVLVAWRAHA